MDAEETVDWSQYKLDQEARREVRRRERLGGLVAVLPPGFSVESIRGRPWTPTLVRIWGWGVEAWFDPTHNSLLYMGHWYEEVPIWRVVQLLQTEAIDVAVRRIWRTILTYC